jgi:hypothetical protein
VATEIFFLKSTDFYICKTDIKRAHLGPIRGSMEMLLGDFVSGAEWKPGNRKHFLMNIRFLIALPSQVGTNKYICHQSIFGRAS